jgi:hypothetical protein
MAVQRRCPDRGHRSACCDRAVPSANDSPAPDPTTVESIVLAVAAEPSRMSGVVLSTAGPHVCAPIDANGNLTANGTRTFEWNGLNQLVAVEINQDRVEFGYNGALQRATRVSKQNDVVQSEFNAVWCDGQTCEEQYVGANPWTRRLLNGGEVGAASSLTTLDHLGSVRDVTTSAAVLTERFEFDPFGCGRPKRSSRRRLRILRERGRQNHASPRGRLLSESVEITSLFGARSVIGGRAN